MVSNYYEILGVSKGASDDEIKKAFRKKAHQYHPDKGGGDEARFKEVNEAYQILSDKDKRAQYDQFGQTFNQAGGAGPSGFGGGGVEDMFRNGFTTSGFSSAGGGSPFGDIFEEFFSGSRGGRRSQGSRVQGEDLVVDLTLEFEEASLGTNREMTYERLGKCNKCNGNGAEPGSKIISCPTCGGSGEIKDNQRTILGFFTQVRPCSECNATGKKAESPCFQCDGAGIERKKEKLSVRIPSGIKNRESLIIRGKGNEVSEGSAGDLYIRVNVSSHKYFEREGNDILLDKKISFSQAALGIKLDVTTLTGDVSLKIPAGIQTGDVLKMKGLGIQRGSGGRKGDQLVRIRVVTPKKLSKKAKELFIELGKVEKKKNKWFF